MKEDLDIQLVKDFPLLYKERHLNPQETCMCWGFPGDGWEPLIRELSTKLEPLIEKYVQSNSPLDCSRCGCDKSIHSTDGCKQWDWKQFSIKIEWKDPPGVKQFKSYINSFLRFLHDNFHIKRKVRCPCDSYSPCHPCASQVKEKFGGLRFYMDHGTQKMRALVNQAELDSNTTCEECGAQGVARRSGWIKTLCDKHAQDKYGNLILPMDETKV